MGAVGKTAGKHTQHGQRIVLGLLAGWQLRLIGKSSSRAVLSL